MGDKGSRKFDTILIHGRRSRQEDGAALLTPVYFTTTFEHESAEVMEDVFLNRRPGRIYTRLQNPTVERLEERITDACTARGTLALASGMSAISLGLQALLRSGDEILAGRFLFGGTYTLFNNTFKEMGIETHFFDPRNPAEAEKLITPKTKAIFLEAISNPAVVVPDFSAYRTLCQKHGLPLLVDATLLTPYLLDSDVLGADLVFFSATKYIAGPSSIMGGLIVDTGRFSWHKCERLGFSDYKKDEGEGALLSKLRTQLMVGVGPCLSPMNAFLSLLGLETLSLRMDKQCETAGKVAEFLVGHERVRQVNYPGFPDNEFHDLTSSQCRGKFGSVFSFCLDSKEHCFKFINKLNLIKRATNLGDTKSIVIHPGSTIYGSFWPQEKEQLGVGEDMIRFSIGLENPADIIADLEQALSG